MERIEREKRVVAQMIAHYCRRKHGGKCLCNDCRVLMDYVMARIDKCPKGERKTSCRKCEIHCYSPQFRMRICEVMRYMGPRMLFVNPVAALRHLWDEMK
ncbi:MAG: nitrous oxide-stimulated promoter family protein [Paramuribaculum sp.]|nr:nitrous oxide-stimulated promoter family protein [Paramuribaculum sp.]